MNIIFLGTSHFAVPALEKLAESRHKIQAVVTQPDRPSGRGLEPKAVPVKVAAQARQLPFFQPAGQKDLLEQLKGFTPDILVVVSYGYILTAGMLETAPRGAVNLHGSFLPEYRGAAPVSRALIEGKTRTGVSVIKMNETVDTGPVILQKHLEILDSDDALTLSARLSQAGADVLLEAVDLIEQGRAAFIPQDDSLATYAPKLDKKDGLVNWSRPAGDIYNRVRGLMPWPGCYTFYNGKILKIWKAEIERDKAAAPAFLPGTIVWLDKKKGIVVQTGRGRLVITEPQLEGKKRMAGAEFIAGSQIRAGEVLGQ